MAKPLNEIDYAKDPEIYVPRFEWQRMKPTVDASGDGRTKTEFTDECDINKLYARFQRTGQIPEGKAKPLYMDLTVLPESYQDSLNLINKVSDEFMSLPAEERLKYHNDPRNYLADLEGRKAAIDAAGAEFLEQESALQAFERNIRTDALKASKQPKKAAETPPEG